MKSPPQRPARMPTNSPSAQKDEEEAIECPRRPNKLVKSPPSGRPSVTFSLVLEQEMGSGSPQQESSSSAEAADKKCEGREKKCTKGKAPVSGNSSWSSPIFYADNGGGEGGGEPLVLLLGFCLPVPLMDCARFVGWLATVPMVFSLLMLPLAPASLFELVPELLLLCTQLLCVLALFFGLQHRQPAYLRPFLLFGLFWSLLLLLLLLFSLIELLVARRRFCAHIWLTVQELLHGEQPRKGADDQQQQMGMELEALAAQFVVQQLYREDQQQGGDGETTNAPLLPSTIAPSILVGEKSDQRSPVPGCWLSWLLCASLALAILVDGWLLNIVLLAYLHLKAEQRETLAKVKRRRHQGQRQWPQSCPEEAADESADGSSQRQALLASSPGGNKTAEYGLVQQQWQQRSSNNAN